MDYKESYVAFLDILGFKDLIQTEDFDRILDVFKHIADLSDLETVLHRAVDEDDKSEEALKFRAYNVALSGLRIYAMSDSIVISSESGIDYSLDVLIDAVIMLQNRLYELDKPVLLRGAVSKGNYYCDKSVAFGKGMVDAYLYQEHYSRYPRIIVSKDLSQEVTDKTYISSNDYNEIAEDSGKLFLDEDDYYHIDALKEFLAGKKHEDPECKKFKSLIDKYLNGYYDEGIREKYRWLNDDYLRVVENVVKANLLVGRF